MENRLPYDVSKLSRTCAFSTTMRSTKQNTMRGLGRAVVLFFLKAQMYRILMIFAPVFQRRKNHQNPIRIKKVIGAQSTAKCNKKKKMILRKEKSIYFTP